MRNGTFVIVGLLLVSVLSVMVPKLGAGRDGDVRLAAGDGQGDSSANPSPCDNAAGYAGDVWDVSLSYNAGEVVEYPTGSFQFYIADANVGAGITPGSAGAVGRWVACDCEDIAVSWDPLFAHDTGYSQYAVVEYPVGSGSYYISVIDSNGYTPGTQNQLEMWAPCDGDYCQDSGGYGGPWYDQSVSNGAGYMTDDVVEYPMGSGMFYISMVDNNLQHPMTLKDWVKCSCSDLYDGSSVATLFSPGNPITVNGVAPSPADNYLIVDVNGVLYLFWFNGGGVEGPELRRCTTDNCNPAVEYWNIGSAAAGYYDVGVIVRTQSTWGGWNLLWTSQIENNGVAPPGMNGEWERCIPRHIALDPVKGDGPIVLGGPKTGGADTFAMVIGGQAFGADVFDAGGGKLVLSTSHSSTGVGISDADAGISGPGGPEDIKGCWVKVIDPYDGSSSAYWEDPCRVSTAVAVSNGSAEGGTEARSVGMAPGGKVETGCWVITTYNGQVVVDYDTGEPIKEWIDPCPYSKSGQVDPSYGEVGCWVSATTWATGECETYRLLAVDALPPIVVSTCEAMNSSLECGARIVIPTMIKNSGNWNESGSIYSDDSRLSSVGQGGPGDVTGCWVKVIDPYDGSSSAYWEDPCRVSTAVAVSNGSAEGGTEARSVGMAPGGKVETGCWVITTYNGQVVVDYDTGEPIKEWIDPCPYGNIISNDFTFPNGTNVTVFYMLGNMCDNFDLAEDASCEDAVVSIEIEETVYGGCWVTVTHPDGSTAQEYFEPCPYGDGEAVLKSSFEDTDGDGVPNDWDDCLETGLGVATDADGCEVKAEGGSDADNTVPGFTGLVALSAIGAMAVLMRRRMAEE